MNKAIWCIGEYAKVHDLRVFSRFLRTFAYNHTTFHMFAKEIYQVRRRRLCDQLSSGLVLLPGNTDVPVNYSGNAYPFRQDSHFLYFVGIDLPELFVVLDVDSRETTLFADELTMDDIIWTGPKESYSDMAKRSGIDKVLPVASLEGVVNRARHQHRQVHFLPPYRAENALRLSSLLEIHTGQLKDASSLSLIKAVVALRSIKGPEEIQEIERAASIGYLMHETVMRNARDGRTERELATLVEGIALNHGAGLSFPVILTQRGDVLHGHDHNQVLRSGRLLLCDAGAESTEHYASDFTRTTPVNGRFSSIQKSLYQVVLDANNKAFELIKPGITYKSVHLECCRLMAEGLKALGLMKGNAEDAVAEGAHALFMVHGLGHMMGLDVHDMEDLGEDYVGYDDQVKRSEQFGLRSLRLARRLEKNFVLTVEPGLYFIPALIDRWQAEKRHTDFICYKEVSALKGMGGIRIEDNARVTETGCKITGERRLPVTPGEIEALLT